jgi:predicted ester cyclase
VGRVASAKKAMTNAHQKWFDLLFPGHDDRPSRNHAQSIPASVLSELFDDAHELHQDLMQHLPRGGGGVRLGLEELGRCFSQTTIEALDSVAEGEMRATRFRMVARHSGKLSHFPSTGKWVSTTGAVMTRFARGVAVETWLEVDAFAVLSTVGALEEEQGSEGATR